MMALGDALAMTLVKKRGFTREEFAAFHPGGDLGRSLMLVSEIMRTGDRCCVIHECIETKQAIRLITETKGRPGAAAVVDTKGQLIGIFTDGTLRRCLSENTDFLLKPIGEVCARTPTTIAAEKLAQEAARIMQERQFDQLIVIDANNTPVGLIDVQDLLAHGLIRPER
jgi:arabinose-5-phosphate isomerase